MSEINLKHLLNCPIIGYAHHQLILDDAGKPADYIFLDVNSTFEMITGLKKETILNRTVKDVIPGIEKNVFDWIAFYGDVALDGAERETDQYSDHLNKWYRVYAYSTEKLYFSVVFIDITQRKLGEEYREISRQILHVLNEPGSFSDIIKQVIGTLKRMTGFDAVGIRLKEGDDYPYYSQEGFSAEFIELENSLTERDEKGGICRDKDDNVCLECTCGMVITGKTAPAGTLCTSGGSFWTNDSFPLLEIPLNEDPRHNPRNNCIHLNYASVVLVPIRSREIIVGLIQFNDRRKDLFTLEIVELLEGVASHIGSALMRKQMEKENDRVKAELIQSQRLQSIGTLAAGIAHEINSPLQFTNDNIDFISNAIGDYMKLINTYKDLLMSCKTDTDKENTINKIAEIEKRINLEFLTKEMPDALSQTKDGIARIRKIVNAMKHYSNLNLEEKKPADINQTLDNAEIITGNEWKYHAEIENDFAKDLPYLTCFEPELNQVFMNLIVNAAHATKDAVDQKLIEKGKITIKTSHEDGKILVAVSDNGTGIPEKIRERVYDPFFTTKDVGKGTGQGLAIAHKAIVDRHGGKIWFDTEINKGTTFFVEVPL